MGRRVLGAVVAVLACVAVASAQPSAGEVGAVDVQSSGARLGLCEVFDFGASDYSPSRSGNVCSVPLSAAVTKLGSTIGDDSGELYQGTALPATCDVGEEFIETDQAVPSTSADVCWKYACTATNTWECLGDVNAGGRTGGQTIIGGAAADEHLTLQSTTNADRGSIRIDPDFSPTDATETLLTFGYTFSSGSAIGVRSIADTSSLTCSGVVGHAYRAVLASPTVVSSTSTCLAGTAYLMEAAPTLSVTTASSNMHAFRGANLKPTFTVTNVAAATEATSNGGVGGVDYGPTFAVTGASGSWTKGHDHGLYYQPTLTTNTAGGAMTLTDSYGVRVVNASLSGAGTETLTRQNGIAIAALTSGTDNFPIRLTEAAASTIATVPASAAIITATSGAPNRITIVNENEQRFDIGYVTWTGSTGSALAADNTTRFFAADTRTAPDTTEGNHDVAMPGPATVVYMACSVNVAPDNGANTQTRTFTLREAAGNTAVACTVSEADTNCTWCQTGTAGCDATGTAEAIASGALVNISAAAAQTPAASDASCALWWTLDAF